MTDESLPLELAAFAQAVKAMADERGLGVVVLVVPQKGFVPHEQRAIGGSNLKNVDLTIHILKEALLGLETQRRLKDLADR